MNDLMLNMGTMQIMAATKQKPSFLGLGFAGLGVLNTHLRHSEGWANIGLRV